MRKHLRRNEQARGCDMTGNVNLPAVSPEEKNVERLPVRPSSIVITCI